MNITDVISLKWLDAENTLLGGNVVSEQFGTVPICIHDGYDTDDGQRIWDNAKAGLYGSIFPYEAPPEKTAEELREQMQSLARVDYRLRMKKAGVTTSVIDAAIAAVTDEELREDYEIIWEDSQQFARLDPLVIVVFEFAGKTPGQADAIWNGE